MAVLMLGWAACDIDEKIVWERDRDVRVRKKE